MKNIKTFEGFLSKFKDQIVQSATNIFNPRKEDNEIADKIERGHSNRLYREPEYYLKIDSIQILCSYYKTKLIFDKVNSIYEKEEEKEEDRQLIKKDIKNHFSKK